LVCFNYAPARDTAGSAYRNFTKYIPIKKIEPQYTKECTIFSFQLWK